MNLRFNGTNWRTEFCERGSRFFGGFGNSVFENLDAILGKQLFALEFVDFHFRIRKFFV